MLETRTTAVFLQWFKGLKDQRAKARIQVRIDRMERGNLGFVQRSSVLIFLLSGGDKDFQSADIVRAKDLAMQLEG